MSHSFVPRMVQKQNSVTEKKVFFFPQRTWCHWHTPVPETGETDSGQQRLMSYQNNLFQAGTSPETGQPSPINPLNLSVEKSDSKTPGGGGQAMGELNLQRLWSVSHRKYGFWQRLAGKKKSTVLKNTRMFSEETSQPDQTHWAFIRAQASVTLRRENANLSTSYNTPVHLSIHVVCGN